MKMKRVLSIYTLISVLFFVVSCDNTAKEKASGTEKSDVKEVEGVSSTQSNSHVSNIRASEFVVDVTVDGANDGTSVRLAKWNDGDWDLISSGTLKDGKTVMKGEIKSPEMCYMFLDGKIVRKVFLDSGEIKIKGNKDDLKNFTVEGSKAQDLYDYYFKNVLSKVNDKREVIISKYKEAVNNKNKEKTAEYLNELKAIEKEKKLVLIDFVKENPDKIPPIYILNQAASKMTYNELNEAVSSISPSLSDNEYVKKVKEKLVAAEKTQIGKHFIDFTMNDLNGNPIKLSDIVKKNKYVLIVFWAGWDDVSKLENKYLRKEYKKLHNKGLEIMAVSLDKNKNEWEQAVKTNKFSWINVSDLKYWRNNAVKLYGVEFIPYNFLIGPDGKIIAKGLRYNEIEDKMK
jgi:peroxiredoxin